MNQTLLDVTLRDGGYRNRFQFSAEFAASLVSTVHSAGIDVIEIGYRGGSLKKIENIGPSGLCSDEYIQTIREKTPNAKLAVMVHPHNISVVDLLSLKNLGVYMVRICVNPMEIARSLSMVEAAKSLGFLTTANLTRISYSSIEKIKELAKSSEKAGANVIYFADSNGHLIPEDVTNYTLALRESVRCPIGFHAHNNLSLALANTTAALQAGVTFVDSSMCGMGRGAGNLSTELFVAYLERVQKNLKYNLVTILELAEEIQKSSIDMKIQLNDLLFGTANFSGDFETVISDVSKSENVPMHKLAYELSKLKPQKPLLAEIVELARRIKRLYA